jgi:hypothetical protein
MFFRPSPSLFDFDLRPGSSKGTAGASIGFSIFTTFCIYLETLEDDAHRKGQTTKSASEQDRIR